MNGRIRESLFGVCESVLTCARQGHDISIPQRSDLNLVKAVNKAFADQISIPQRSDLNAGEKRIGHPEKEISIPQRSDLNDSEPGKLCDPDEIFQSRNGLI